LKNWKGFFFVYTAISILLFCSKTAEASSVSYNSILTEEADWIEIADFKELRSIMNGSIRPQTRHIRLPGEKTTFIISYLLSMRQFILIQGNIPSMWKASCRYWEML